MEPMMIIAMGVNLIVVAMIAGTILLFPVSRRLAALLEKRLEGYADPELKRQVEDVTRELERTRREFARLEERQRFTERLLDRGLEEERPGNVVEAAEFE